MNRMNLKKVLIVLIFWLFSTQAFATAQFPDNLLYKGQKLPIFSNPLESYFSKENPRPRELFRFSCTAVWRGYVASWKIEDGYLYLTKVVEGTCSSDAKEIPIGEIFPKKEAPVKAVWFSGNLKIPQGKQMRYVHMGYESTYEKELILTIEKGKLTRETVIDNTKKMTPASK